MFSTSFGCAEKPRPANRFCVMIRVLEIDRRLLRPVCNFQPLASKEVERLFVVYRSLILARHCAVHNGKFALASKMNGHVQG